MELLRRVWNDIQKGENIDLYVTVSLAIGLVTLSFFNIGMEEILTKITLAVLGLLAISILGNRYRIEKLLREKTITLDSIFMEEFPSEVYSKLDEATTISLIGVSLSRTIKKIYKEMERKLSLGHSIKILLVDPESSASKIASDRDYWKPDYKRTQGQIYDSLNLLCELQRQYSDNLEIHVTSDPLSYGVIAYDPGSTSGILFVEHYPYKESGGGKSIPKLVLQAKDGKWYDFFCGEINSLWKNSEVWNCSYPS